MTTLRQFFNSIKDVETITISVGQYELRMRSDGISHNLGDGFWHTMPDDNTIETMAINKDAIMPDEIRILDKTGQKVLVIQRPSVIILFK